MSQKSITAYSTQVLNTIEHILVPGGRAKLSPYLEDTQIRKLFAEAPSPEKRNQTLHRILAEKDQRIQRLAQLWAERRSSESLFDADSYTSEDDQDLYLLYYFSTNVLKVQLMLLDLIRSNQLEVDLQVEDLGVGTGTTSLAVLDFLFLWKVVCDLYGAVFPVESLTYRGVDRNRNLLDYAREVVQTYCRVLLSRETKLYENHLDFLTKSSQDFEWLENDIGSDEFALNPDSNLIVISYVLNELPDRGKKVLARQLQDCRNGTTILCIEPGSGGQAKSLMGWRCKVMGVGDWSTGPCGNGYLRLPSSCGGCWNSRHHSLHESVLYRRFRKHTSEFEEDPRGFNDFQNRLLSWSAFWLKKGQNPGHDSRIPETILTENDSLRDEIKLQYIGTYVSGHKSHPKGAADFDPDEYLIEEQKQWKEYLKFCPGKTGANGLAMIREPGFQIPDLKHGDVVGLKQGKLSKHDQYWEIKLNTESQLDILDERRDDREFLTGSTSHTERSLNEIGYRLFGFPELHPFQHTIMGRVLQGKSILGIAATGSGKSECFILPAMVLPGVTVVVSPLLSLMMDQYDQRIQERYGLGNLATFINGEVPFKERRARLKRMELGYYKLVYFTPEQLERGYILDSLRRTDDKVGVRYLAMDEAHCISQWGHDFRPSYLNLSRRFADHGMHPVRIALTATASPFVRQDICEELQLNPYPIEDGGDLLIDSSNRPELNLIVETNRNTEGKVRQIVDRLIEFQLENIGDQEPGSAIVFMPHTGGDPDEEFRTKGGPDKGKLSTGVTPFAAYLERELKTRVSIYHGKMEQRDFQGQGETVQKEGGDLSGRTRRGEQESFISGEKDIMVATKGFGMGIDKDNVRLIIHRTPPGNLESYAQEAGRAGRDGYQADVVLHHSPDPPEIEGKRSPSDYEIQEFFLRDKYVRKIDIQAMVGYLRTLKMERGTSTYFTNDQVIAFIDHLRSNPDPASLSAPYQWPTFPERRIHGYESPEHARILDLGWVYQQKSDYVNKILQVLYKIRPSVQGIARLTFLEQLDQTGIKVIRPDVKQPDQIIQSNAYFGEILRKAGVDSHAFSGFLSQETIIPLSEMLGLSLQETANLLRDIKYSEGRFNRYDQWLPGLLDFSAIVPPRWGPAQGISDLDTWRMYAGAFGRASKPKAHARAKRAGRPMKSHSNKKGKYPETILDDWFSWKECNKSRGWEIVPGEAFFNPQELDEYTRAFIELHNRREKNDWASYHRLLTGYIGVDKQGHPARSGEGAECLRSVLLGYLDTNEVVTGGNCYSCSRCVPDHNFRRFSMEERKSAVVKLRPGISSILDTLEQQTDQLPARDQMNDLFLMIIEEKEQEQSVAGYLSGWSIRLLDQIPDHQAAIWVRISGMFEGILPLPIEEFVDLIRKMISRSGMDLSRLEEMIDRFPEAGGPDPEWHFLKAEIYERTDQPLRAVDAYQQGIQYLIDENETVDKSKIFELTSRCIQIARENELSFQPEWRRYLGRTTADFDQALEAYSRIIEKWSWRDVEEELRAQEKFPESSLNQAGLIIARDQAEKGEGGQTAQDYILEHPRKLDHWPDKAVRHFQDRLPLEFVLSSRKFFNIILTAPGDPGRAVKAGIEALLGGRKLSRIQANQLFEQITRKKSFARDYLGQQLENPGDHELKTRFLAEVLPENHLVALIPFLKIDYLGLTLDQKLNLLKHGVQEYQSLQFQSTDGSNADNLSADTQKKALIDILLGILEEFLENEVFVRQGIAILMDAADDDQSLLIKLLWLLESRNLTEEADRMLDRLVHAGQLSLLADLKDLPDFPRWKRVCYFAEKAAFLQSLRFFDLSRTLESYHIKTICQSFDWEEDQEKADMLAVVLDHIIDKKLNPYWKTPLAQLMEVYVEAGRIEQAQSLVETHSGLLIHVNGKRVSARKFVSGLRPGEREHPISQDYSLILENSIG